MADGFARSSDKVGVVITSTGPGAANVVGSLVEARFAGTPLLHITVKLLPKIWIKIKVLFMMFQINLK